MLIFISLKGRCILYMNKKKYKGILRLFKKKTFKLSVLGLALVGLLISSGTSFAKYKDENYGGGNAGAAKFGTWTITQSIVRVNIPENRQEGYYAFVADFNVTFSEGEVAREYTLKVKAVDNTVTANETNFNSASKANAIYYFLDSSTLNATTLVYTIKDNAVIGSDRNNIIGLLTEDSSFSTFNLDTIYSYEGEERNNVMEGSWAGNSKNNSSYYDSSSDSVYLTSNHRVNANESDKHLYKIIFFLNTNQISEESNFKFIYSLDVRQVN